MFDLFKKKKKKIAANGESSGNSFQCSLKYEPNRNNRFIINIGSKILQIQEWWVRTLRHDNYHRMVMNVFDFMASIIFGRYLTPDGISSSRMRSFNC